MNKQTAKIENWSVLASCLMGHITDHDRQDDFKAEMQLTSRIVKRPKRMREGDTVETENTIYELGKRAA